MDIQRFENPHTEQAWTFLKTRLKEAGIETFLNPDIELFEFKTGDENTEVMKLPVIFRFSLATLDNVLSKLETITTNDRINREIYKQVELLNMLGEMLQGMDIDSLPRDLKSRDVDAIDTHELFRRLVRINPSRANHLMEIGFYENEVLYRNKQQLREIVGGERAVNVKLEIVYKRIDGAEKQIQREIEYYKEFQEKGINTFCAFTFKYVDPQGGAYDFTKFEGDLTTIANTRRLFQKNNRGESLFKIILDELLKAHTQGLLHGDLHFKNVGVVEDDDGKYIILFDLVRASTLKSTDNITQKLASELLIFGQNTLFMAERLANTPEIKSQIKVDLQNYLNSLQEKYPNLDTEFIKNFCFSNLYAFLG